MFLRISVAALLCLSLSLHAQQPAPPVEEPQYRDQYNVLRGGQLLPLERETMNTDMQTRRNFVITPNTKVYKSIPNTSSPVRVSQNIQFVVKMATGDRDPQTLIHLHKLMVKKKDRQIPIVTYKQSLIPFGGVKHDRAPDESIPVKIEKFGTNSLLITPETALEPGEYGFVGANEAQCFGVDAGVSDSNAPHAAAAKATPPPPPPSHPASTVVDLPPAAPGFPPMHASMPAPDGCWWVPFLSEKLGLEMLIQKCEPGKMPGGQDVAFITGDGSVSALISGSNDAVELFRIYSKLPAQTITAAIRSQFIGKLEVPAARTSCKAIRNEKATGPGETYTVEATGPYSKLKKFNNDEGTGEDPCPDLGSDDVVGRSFLYLPDESKTKFIFFQVQESWPFDQNSIHFHTD